MRLLHAVPPSHFLTFPFSHLELPHSFAMNLIFLWKIYSRDVFFVSSSSSVSEFSGLTRTFLELICVRVCLCLELASSDALALEDVRVEVRSPVFLTFWRLIGEEMGSEFAFLRSRMLDLLVLRLFLSSLGAFDDLSDAGLFTVGRLLSFLELLVPELPPDRGEPL